MDDVTLLAWIEKGKTLSVFLVALGVVGEFLGDRLEKPVRKRLDDAHAAVIAQLGKDAAGASAEAAHATERAARAEQQAAQTAGGTAHALKEAAAANERAGKLEIEAAGQRERAAKAERDLLELRERLKPRQFTTEQRAKLTDGLKRATPKGLVEIFCVLGDGEGLRFANEMDEILKDAGWPTSGVNQGVYPGGNPVGYGLIVHAVATAPPYAAALQRSFEQAGIEMQGLEVADLAEGTVRLLIGNKPPPQ
jgi:hypothetical protein